jgi:MoxR-like ATPase
MQPTLERLFNELDHLIVGKSQPIRLAIAALLARGHLLIEDLPGVGKTTLSHAIATLLGLECRRIQFTSDLLPGDITGSSIYHRNSESFTFIPGPLFSNVVIADEINRATPRTQSALLEAMAERQITVQGTTYPLPETFFVIATQNPYQQLGTYPLPESQRDRFLLTISLGYPDSTAERALLTGDDRLKLLKQLKPLVDEATLKVWQDKCSQIFASSDLIDYLQALIHFSRNSGLYRYGLSPRAALGLLAAARGWAMINSRKYLIPEDLQTILPHVAAHRLVTLSEGRPLTYAEVIHDFSQVAIP